MKILDTAIKLSKGDAGDARRRVFYGYYRR